MEFDAIALIYSHDFGRWEPYASVKRIFQWGDPLVEDVPRLVSRFQESEQTIWAFAAGLEHRAGATFGFEVGVLTNRYSGSDRLADLFVGARVTP